MQHYLEIGMGTFGSAALAALAWALSALSVYLSKRKHAADQSMLSDVLYDAENLMVTIVSSINETSRAELTKLSSDGKLTSDEFKLLKDAAVAEFNNVSSEEFKKLINRRAPDLNKFLGHLVEKALESVKFSKKNT